MIQARNYRGIQQHLHDWSFVMVTFHHVSTSRFVA
jgi:hypothetical protein